MVAVIIHATSAATMWLSGAHVPGVSGKKTPHTHSNVMNAINVTHFVLNLFIVRLVLCCYFIMLLIKMLAFLREFYHNDVLYYH